MEKGFFKLYNKKGKKLITATRENILKTLSTEALNDIVSSILCGGNIREVTENTTKNRLFSSYAALLELFTKIYKSDNKEYFDDIRRQWKAFNNKSDKAKLLYLWLMGLTKKGMDNIVRGDDNIDSYVDALYETISINEKILENEFGALEGEIILDGNKISIDWRFICNLFMAIGSQTLTVRGSDKSMNGKLFERLILGSLISMLGFEYCEQIPSQLDVNKKIFCLSSTGDNDRETDATILFNKNAIAIDIGFIGKGNPEISLDKATRFRKNKEYGKLGHIVSTVIIGLSTLF